MGTSKKYTLLAIVIKLLVALPVTLAGKTIVNINEICKNLDPCDKTPRHIMFILDASLSIDQERFDREAYDYIQKLYCAFEPEGSMAGLIVFNKNIQTVIPMGSYSKEEWAIKVEEAREKKLCCSCCTPTAEAFDLAAKEFKNAAYSINSGKSVMKVALTITDGVPHQNFGSKDECYNMRMPKSTYLYKTVPEAANKLKDQDVRVMMFNVPSAEGYQSKTSYFAGDDMGNKMCSKFKGDKDHFQEYCETMESPNFPIVSTPAISNIFINENWNVQTMVDDTVQKVCDEAWVPKCGGGPKDILFVVDASLSMPRDRFYSEMLDVVLNMFNSLEQSYHNRVGLILFKNDIKVAIPMVNRSALEFENEIEKLRRNKKTCCSCCTPTAEAFELAAETLKDLENIGNEQIVIVVTDGVPFQNKGKGKYARNKIKRSVYDAQIVPEAAQKVKDLGARVVLLGLPDKGDEAPNQAYFTGDIVGDICYYHKGKPADCTKREYGYGRFPIVSEPKDANIVTSLSWDLQPLSIDMHRLLCLRNTSSDEE